MVDKAIILARGLGTRMRRPDDDADLDERQLAVAQTGVKALIPVGRGRPFLDYILSALADAGCRRVCLIVGPEHQALRDYYTRENRPRRLRIDYAVQERPLGTADAVRAGEAFAAGEEFLVINSDNYYPPQALGGLCRLDGPGLVGFDRLALLEDSNIPPERIAQYAIVEEGPPGYLRRIVEKPPPHVLAALQPPIRISMNCWRLGPAIFEACRQICPSPRGELELPDAVQVSLERLNQAYRVVGIAAPVLDLSSRADVAPVAARLASVEINL